MKYVDAHNHLHDERLDAVREGALEECARIGVAHCVVNGTSPRDWGRVKALAERYPFVLPSYGVHPWFVDGLPPLWLEDLISLLRSGGCVVGEIGIDHWKDGIDRELQEEVFLKQLAVARQLNLPVTIHGLKAWDRLLQLLKSEGAPKAGFLLHSYSGPASLVGSFVELGAYFSCAPAFFAPSRGKKLQVFRQIPLERILAETDSPDQAPPNELSEFSFSDESAVGLNHPANIRLVYDGLAKLRQMPASSMAEKILENYQQLFG